VFVEAKVEETSEDVIPPVDATNGEVLETAKPDVLELDEAYIGDTTEEGTLPVEATADGLLVVPTMELDVRELAP